jgi:hypothetical protein
LVEHLAYICLLFCRILSSLLRFVPHLHLSLRTSLPSPFARSWKKKPARSPSPSGVPLSTSPSLRRRASTLPALPSTIHSDRPEGWRRSRLRELGERALLAGTRSASIFTIRSPFPNFLIRLSFPLPLCALYGNGSISCRETEP